ncbi:MAG: DsbE family thiol:disulfide interchange protein [Cardiobacteriaceae bacterium]|nr:DsbE family thiol:disulfide interchange protein [Cardiobacteriaceae bacterium]
MKKTLPLALLILGIFLAITAFFVGGLGKNPRELPSVMTGKALPAFNLPALDGNTRHHNGDLPQGPFLLNVWASWCPACHIEHPYLLKLGKEIPIVGLNWPANNASEAQDAALMLKRQGNPYRLVIVDSEGRMTTDLGVYGAPETFLIAADGTILHRHAGPMDARIWRETFQPLLGGKP